MVNKDFTKEVDKLLPFIKPLYEVLREKRWEPEDIIDIMTVTAKVCYANELTTKQ